MLPQDAGSEDATSLSGSDYLQIDGNNQYLEKEEVPRMELIKRKDVIKNILLASLPIILDNASQTVADFVNSIVYNHANQQDKDALSYTSLANTPIDLVKALYAFPVITLVTRSYQAGSPERAGAVLQNAWVLACALTPPAMLIVWFFGDILELCGQPQESVALLKEYTQPVALSILPTLLTAANLSIVLALSKQKFLTVWGITTFGSGLLLNILLTFGVGNLPKLGVRSYGIAILAQSVIGCVSMKSYILFHPDFKMFKLTKFRAHKNINELLTILRLGAPILIKQAVDFGAGFFISMAMGRAQPNMLAINNVGTAYVGLADPIAYGFQTITALEVARQIEKGLLPNARRYHNIGMFMTVATEVVPLAILAMFPLELAKAFLGEGIELDDQEEMMRIVFMIVAINSLLQNLQTMTINNLQALYDTLVPSLINIIATVAIVAPLPYLLGFVADGGLIGATSGMAIGVGVSLTLILRRWYNKTADIVVEEEPLLSRVPLQQNSLFKRAKNGNTPQIVVDHSRKEDEKFNPAINGLAF